MFVPLPMRTSYGKARIRSLFLGRRETWSGLQRLGSSRLVATSYSWLILVPIAAKLLSHIDGTINPVVVTLFNARIPIIAALPFSWRMLYFSALCFSIAVFVYNFWCPKIVREFRNYRDFSNEGHSGRCLGYLLRDVVERSGSVPNDEASENISEHFIGGVGRKNLPIEDDFINNYLKMQSAPSSTQELSSSYINYEQFELLENKEMAAFWALYGYADRQPSRPKFWCLLMYRLGICLAAVVLLQNVWFVLAFR